MGRALLFGLLAAPHGSSATDPASPPPALPRPTAAAYDQADPVSAPTPGAASAGPVFPLANALDEALRENAEVRAARARAAALDERPAQARALPNPMLAAGAMGPAEDYRPFDAEETRLGVQQPLPGFGKRGLRGRVAAKAAETGHADYEAVRRDVVMQLKAAYYELFALQRLLAIVRAEQAVLERMEENARTRYATGSVTQQDVLKAQSESALLRLRLVEQEYRARAVWARLHQILNRPAHAPPGRAVTPPPSTEAAALPHLLTLAEAARPELGVARARVEQAGLERTLARREFCPDFSLGLESRTFKTGDDMLMAMVGMDLPVWWGKTRAGIREADRTLEAARAGLQAAQQQTAYEVQDAYYRRLAARSTLDLYRQALLPQAEARFAASEAGYRTGKTDFLDVLESERFLLEARTMAATAERDLGMETARLEWAVGVEWERLTKQAEAAHDGN